MITLTVGDHHTLTAQFRDSLNQPVTNVDPGFLVWTTDNDSVVSLGPNVRRDRSNTVIPATTGLIAVIKAVSPGTVNVTATYNSGANTFTNVTVVQVNPPAVASISVT